MGSLTTHSQGSATSYKSFNHSWKSFEYLCESQSLKYFTFYRFHYNFSFLMSHTIQIAIQAELPTKEGMNSAVTNSIIDLKI